MKSDQDDTDQHESKVLPFDGQNESGSQPESGNSQGTPDLSEVALPPKKETKRAFVTLHEARQKVHPEGAEKPSIESVARKRAGKASNRKKAEPEGRSDRRAGAHEKFAEVEKAKCDVPAAQDGKTNRLRINEISPTTDAGSAIHKREPKGTRHRSNQDQERSDGEVLVKRRRVAQRESNSWGEAKGAHSSKWILYSAVGIVLVMALAVFLNQRAAKRVAGKPEPSLTGPAEAKVVEDDPKPADLLTGRQKEGIGIYAAFATATSLEDFSAYLYSSDTTIPIIEKYWEPSSVSKNWRPTDDSKWTVFEQEGVIFATLEGINADYSRFLAFFRYEESGIKLDWKATVGYCSDSFEELGSGKGDGDGSEIRVWLSPSDFYTTVFPEGEFQSYRLKSPEDDHTLWGYANMEGELQQALRELFLPSQITGEMQSEVQVVLKIEPGPDGVLPNQWIITELIRLNWLDK